VSTIQRVATPSLLINRYIRPRTRRNFGLVRLVPLPAALGEAGGLAPGARHSDDVGQGMRGSEVAEPRNALVA